MEFMRQYDEEQQKAINAENGYYLVLAPPGCGKTDILSERIVRAHDAGVEYSDMLCLTFTNRASRGMRDRVYDVAGDEAQNVFVGNVHRYCSNFLFENSLLPADCCVIDEDDQKDILVSRNEQFFTNGYEQSDKNKINEVIKTASYIHQRIKGHPRTAFFLPDFYEKYYLIAEKAEFKEENVPPGHDIVRMALYYTEFKHEHDYIDFDDILILAYDHLHNDAERKYKRYSWIQVDEVQDLNALQMAVIDELTDTGGKFTVMYLGDAQQAIFSFLGAKLDQLEAMKKRCSGHLLQLNRNYRSPKYLLDIFNTYAEKELHVDAALLPRPVSVADHDKWDLLLVHSAYAEDEDKRIAGMVGYYTKFPGERLAILVPTNAAADRVSDELTKKGIGNFKISGRDMFKSKSYKTLTALMCCVTNEFNVMMWVRLLYGIGAVGKQAVANVLVTRMKNLMMMPGDLLESDSYMSRFCYMYENEEMVYFDTETTGLDIDIDDIVQIAAFKVKGGKKVDGSDFVIFLHTDRKIPEKLGIIDNPLIKAYSENKHYSRSEGLRMFLDYIGDDAVLGHNVMYDYRILQKNAERTLGEDVTLEVFDTLKAAKYVVPGLLRYKLEYLIHVLHLEGKNSHLANEDVEATKMLADYCYKKAKPLIEKQKAFLGDVKVKNIKEKLNKLSPLIEKLKEHIYNSAGIEKRTLADELRETYEDLTDMKLIKPLGNKFDVFLKYIETQWADTAGNTGLSLSEQIFRHINDMTSTVSEGDLVNLVDDRVFIMTVYKGKGLEFDNVVILGANDGTYPFFKVNMVLESHGSSKKEIEAARKEKMEDARKFYVALTRAKKRLCVSYTNFNSYKRLTRMTPFMHSIERFFYTGKNVE